MARSSLSRPVVPDLAGSSVDRRQRGYERHRPEETLLYRLVAEHLETFLAESRERHDRPLPKYVERELRAYLRCGILAHGFGRAECGMCHRQIVVAFSCKMRGLCPSCNARRMCNSAAHLTDRVLPDAPVRQWVLSVPFELRFLLASNAQAFTALTGIFMEETLAWYRRRAVEIGISDGQGGAVSVQHRFGGALNLNCHVHAAVIDGVFTRHDEDQRATFHAVPAPDSFALGDVIERVYKRLVAWLRRKGLLAEYNHERVESTDPSAMDACVSTSLSQKGLVRLDARGLAELVQPGGDGDATAPRKSKGKYGTESLGFNLHAGVRIEAHDRAGREKLLRYCTRAPLSLERLSMTRDGRVAYRLQRPWRRGETHRVMDPVELLARLSALIPPPRHPLLRFHGVLGPHSSWRKSVVPEPAVADAANGQACATTTEVVGSVGSAVTEPPSIPVVEKPRAMAAEGEQRIDAPRLPVPLAATEAVLDPARLFASPKRAPFEPGKARYTSGAWRIDWATLLKRVHDVDALACPCGGRLKFVELVTEADRARHLLRELGLDLAAPMVARARSPTDDFDPPSPDDW